MFKIHQQGQKIVLICFIIFIILNLLFFLFSIVIFSTIFFLLSFSIFFLICFFFRSVNRKPPFDKKNILAPADGKIVAIEEIFEKSYFNTPRIQISIFMSIFDAHINWFPVDGTITSVMHKNGVYKLAYLPKSSEENEQTVVIIKRDNGQEIMVRQIAGALARRIVTNCKINDTATQGQEMGFIKFGSRVDLILPFNIEINVHLNQKVKGAETIIAYFL